MCLPLSILVLLPVPGLLLLAAVLGLSARGPLGVAAAVVMLWALGRGCGRAVRVTRAWWSRERSPAAPRTTVT